MSVPCSEQFIRALLFDLGLLQPQIDYVVCKLKFSESTYETNKPQTNISNIVNDLFNCLRPNANGVANATAAEISTTIIFTIIFTAIFIILIVILLVTMDNSKNYYWIIIFAILFAMFYIIAVYLLLYNARININNEIGQTETAILTCLNNAVTELATFEANTETAINNALCAYSNSNCTPP